MHIADSSRIDRTIDLEAPLERVWRALTDVRELSIWLQVTIDGVVAPGSDIYMTPAGQPDADPFHVHFTEVIPPRRLAWEWHPGPVDPALDYSQEPRTTVTFELEALGSGTRLRMSETGFDAIALERRAKIHADNVNGWPMTLQMLQAHVEAAR